MSYQNSLSPWVIYRYLPNLQRQFIDRFRRRTHAEEYLKVIQRLSPDAEFEIVYEIPQADSHEPSPQIPLPQEMGFNQSLVPSPWGEG